MSLESRQQGDTEAYEQALALLREDRFDEGIAALLEVSRRMPKALGDIVWAYRMRGDNEAAFSYLQQYVRHFPQDTGGWALLAKITFERKAIHEAARYARRAAAAPLTDEHIWFEMGEILFQAHEWKDAACVYGECLKINPSHSKARARQQIALRALGLGRIRALARLWPVRAFMRWILSSRLVGDLIELDMGIAREDGRWKTPLEWGATTLCAESAPPDQNPEVFDAHFRQCQCAFWQWFRALRMDGQMKKVLEVGGGPGHVAQHFTRGGFDVLALTTNESSALDRRERGIAVALGDMHLTGERGWSFDLVVADYGLPQSRAPLLALREWKRVLRPDGYLFVMGHLALDRPAPSSESTGTEHGQDVCATIAHFTYGVPGHVMTLTYWQLRWLFKQAGFLLIAETLEDPQRHCLESVEYVDGRRPADPTRAWDVFFLLRKPGRLPYDSEIEKPRPIKK